MRSANRLKWSALQIRFLGPVKGSTFDCYNFLMIILIFFSWRKTSFSMPELQYNSIYNTSYCPFVLNIEFYFIIESCNYQDKFNGHLYECSILSFGIINSQWYLNDFIGIWRWHCCNHVDITYHSDIYTNVVNALWFIFFICNLFLCVSGCCFSVFVCAISNIYTICFCVNL